MTIYGWDMSHYDDSGIGNAVSQGISFITHKAGGDADDPEIGAWWSGVKGLAPATAMLGAYWVLYPGNPSGRADTFLARLDATCPGWRDRPFILQADCEKWGGDASTVPSKAEIQAFCDRLHSKMPKLTPIAYAPKWVYGSGLAGLSYPLWASSYVSGSGGFKSLYPGDGSSKWATYSGITPAILQYSSSATIGGQSTCDANAFRGTLTQLQDLLAPGWKETDMELTDKIGDETYANRTVGDVFRDLAQLRGFLVGDNGDTASAGIKASAPVQNLVGLKAALPAPVDVTALANALAPLINDVDEAALAAALAPLLNGVNEDEIKDALTTVLRQGIDAQAPPAV
jgi:hypothetical protein